MTTDMTIVTPNYNRKSYLSLAIQTALSQTLNNLEIIVVDDCSTDGSQDLVERIQKIDSRLRLLVHDHNRGPAAARNTGIKGASSRYITFLDSDDLLAPERCQILFARLEAEEDPCVVYTDWVSIDSTQVAFGSISSKASNRPEGMIFPHLVAGDFRFTGSCIAVSKVALQQTGFYDERLRWAEDTDMALRLSLKFPFLFERLATYGWRAHHGGSSEVLQRIQRMSYESRVLEKHIRNNLGSLDPSTKRMAFNRLIGCCVSGRQWQRLARTSLIDAQAFLSLVTLPQRITRKKQNPPKASPSTSG